MHLTSRDYFLFYCCILTAEAWSNAGISMFADYLSHWTGEEGHSVRTAHGNGTSFFIDGKSSVVADNNQKTLRILSSLFRINCRGLPAPWVTPGPRSHVLYLTLSVGLNILGEEEPFLRSLGDVKGEQLGLSPCLCPGGLSGVKQLQRIAGNQIRRSRSSGEMAEANSRAHTRSLPYLV